MKNSFFRFLTVILIVMTMFAFVACNNTPEATPEPTPENGQSDIPQIPDGNVALKNVGATEQATISQMVQDLMTYLEGLFKSDESDELSRGMDKPEWALNGSVSFSAPAASITVNGVKIDNSAFTGSLECKDQSLTLKGTIDITVTPNKGNAEKWDTVDVSLDVISGTGTFKFGKDNTLELRKEKEADPYYPEYEYTRTNFYLNGVKLTTDEDLDAYEQKLETLAIAAISGLSNGSISIDAGATIPVDGKNTVVITTKGNIGLKIKLNPDFFKDDNDGISPVKSGSITVSNLKVEASSAALGIAASVELKDFEVSVDNIAILISEEGNVETESTSLDLSLRFSKFAVSAKAGDEINFSFEITNTSLQLHLEQTETDTLVEYEYGNYHDYDSTTTVALTASADVGFGLKVGKNSIGFVTNLSIDTKNISEADLEKDLVVTPKAATINGEYYNPEQFLAAVMEIGSAFFQSEEE